MDKEKLEAINKQLVEALMELIEECKNSFPSIYQRFSSMDKAKSALDVAKGE